MRSPTGSGGTFGAGGTIFYSTQTGSTPATVSGSNGRLSFNLVDSSFTTQVNDSVDM
jgi:hypothetical protein